MFFGIEKDVTMDMVQACIMLDKLVAKTGSHAAGRFVCGCQIWCAVWAQGAGN